MGRPRGGRHCFTEADIARLPEFGYANQVAKALGISRATMTYWIGNALTEPSAPTWAYRQDHAQHEGIWLIDRVEFVKWLRGTGRCVEPV